MWTKKCIRLLTGIKIKILKIHQNKNQANMPVLITKILLSLKYY